MIAAQENGDLLLLQRRFHLLVDGLTYLDNLIQVTGVRFSFAGLAAISYYGHADVAAVVNYVTETGQSILQSGIAYRARPHIDAAPLLPQIHRYAETQAIALPQKSCSQLLNLKGCIRLLAGIIGFVVKQMIGESARPKQIVNDVSLLGNSVSSIQNNARCSRRLKVR